MTRYRPYYCFKPYIPRTIQIYLRRLIVGWQRKRYQHIWPIDPEAAKPPRDWVGWPGGKRFAFVLSHDVDTPKGYKNSFKLLDIDEKHGFRSSLNFVPEQRYGNSDTLIKEVFRRGFEVRVHGLNHDGKLFNSQKEFSIKAKSINSYLEAWNAEGFTSPSMHHKLEWMHELNIKNSTATFDTDPFEPQPDGSGTIFPFWVQNSNSSSRFLELPYTLPQDFTLFILMKEQSIKIWKEKLDWIAEKGGMALLNTHSDYMNFNGGKPGPEEYPVELYIKLLKYLNDRYKDSYYHALPKEIYRFWSEKMGGDDAGG